MFKYVLISSNAHDAIVRHTLGRGYVIKIVKTQKAFDCAMLRNPKLLQLLSFFFNS